MLYDVIVIGGGPVGSRVAYQLARAGYEIKVLEKKRELGQPVCCTGIVSEECIRTFDINQSVLLRHINEAQIQSPGGQVLKVWHPTLKAFVIKRGAFDNLMAQKAAENGAEFLLNSNVERVEIKRDCASIFVQNGPGRNILTSRCVVIAGGYGSCKLINPATDMTCDYAIGVQSEVKIDSRAEAILLLGKQYAPGFFSWLVPFEKDKAFVGLMARHNASYHFKVLVDTLNTSGKIRETDIQPSFRVIPLSPIKKTYGHRWVAVGSAAGQVKPLTGGGIYYGLLCADIAADTIISGLKRNELSGSALKDYERNWKKLIGKEIRTGSWARQLFEQLSDPQIDLIFNFVRDKDIVNDLAKIENLSFDWHSDTIKFLLKTRLLKDILKLIKSSLSPSFTRGKV